jgi:hypothetical protein
VHENQAPSIGGLISFFLQPYSTACSYSGICSGQRNDWPPPIGGCPINDQTALRRAARDDAGWRRPKWSGKGLAERPNVSACLHWLPSLHISSKELIFFIIALPPMGDGIQQVSIFHKHCSRNFVSLKRCFLRIESTWTTPTTFCWWVTLMGINNRCSLEQIAQQCKAKLDRVYTAVPNGESRVNLCDLLYAVVGDAVAAPFLCYPVEPRFFPS